MPRSRSLSRSRYGFRSMSRPLGLALCVALLAGCATPLTVLRHPTTGATVQCGGGRGGSAIGGLIGYNLQKDSDERCVRDHEARGYRR